MASALLSLALNHSLEPTVAMTGELTVTGKVLRIGGLREKTVAARRAGATKILFPADNTSDWLELPEVSFNPFIDLTSLTSFFSRTSSRALKDTQSTGTRKCLISSSPVSTRRLPVRSGKRHWPSPRRAKMSDSTVSVSYIPVVLCIALLSCVHGVFHYGMHGLELTDNSRPHMY
jgi:predicted S18 family serine protease